MKSLDDLIARLPALQEKARQRAAQEQASAPAKVVQLPLWPEPVRAVPNGFLRSALFGAIAKGKRRYIDGEQLAALDGIEIRYTGQRLDQGDLDVWESVLHAVRLQELGSQCRLTSYGLLKLMGKTDTGKNRATLHKRITRLRAGTVELKQGRYVYIGGLIGEAFKDEETQEWVIELNPKLRALYGGDQFTQVDWGVRHALDGRQLAQWLHGFYANPRSAQQTLRKALEAVAEASEANGEGFSYEIRGDLVHVEKKASGTQRLHLAKKAAQRRKPRT